MKEYKCKYCKKKIIVDKPQKFIAHQRWCFENPKRDEYLCILRNAPRNGENQFTKSKKDKVSDAHHRFIAGTAFRGKHHTMETRERISDKMKQAHKNNLHPGWKHINGDVERKSYPEKFFIKVLKNNGLYEKYRIAEKMSFGKYFLDFAFIDLKLVVEMDGEQHYRKESIKHDRERDKFLQENGWCVYRIRWTDMFSNPKNEIEKVLAHIAQMDEHHSTKVVDESSSLSVGTSSK